MAHELADSKNDGSSVVDKDLLNRREYLKVGAAATAIAFGSSSGVVTSASGESSATFATGFGEYA